MTDGTPAGTATDAGTTITRVFDAPRELVFKAWTEPEQFAEWFGGRDAEVLVTVVLTDLGDNRTEMVFSQDGGHLPPEDYARVTEGWSGFFDTMAELLAEA
jgi:uncharacterized protein YndB with AHSA1/START domain